MMQATPSPSEATPMGLSPAPLYEAVAEGPEGGRAFWIDADDGKRLRVGYWPSATAKGTVLLFPGRTEYIEKYGRAACDLGARGFATVTIDWRGQGISDRMTKDRLTGHVGIFQDYQRDVSAMVSAARALGAPEPFFLIGHSMGGCIGLRALHEGLPVAAAAFSAPMWGIGLSPFLRPVAWTLSNLSRRVGLGHIYPPGTVGSQTMIEDPFEDNLLTKDAEMYAYMQRQLNDHPDLGLGAPSMQWLHEALMETRTLAGMASPALPCVTHLGLDERIVDVARVRARMSQWANGRLVEVPGGEHEVMMEVKAARDAFFDDAAGLFSAHS